MTAWSKFFLILSNLGHYHKPKIKCEKNLELLKNLLRCKKKKKIPFMTWEIWFSPNSLPDLTPLLLLPVYTFWWASELSLLLQVHWYMAELTITPKLDIKGKRQRKRKATFSNKQKTLLCKLLILSTPQSLQNGTFDCRQCWQPKSSKATRCRGTELQSLECLPERHARIKQL